MIERIPHPIRLTVLALFLLELLSFVAWAIPWVGTVVVLVLAVLTFVFSVKDLRLGIAFVLLELIIGSHGYLFSIPLGSHAFSLRLAVFLAVFAAGVYRMIREKKIALRSSFIFWPYCILVVCIFWAVISGLIHQNGAGNVFSDGNAFLFFGLAFPLWQAIRTKEDLLFLLPFAGAGLAVSIFEVFFLEYVFSHRFWWMLAEVYHWVRDTRIGEITQVNEQVFHRIFLPSQIYAIAGFFLLLLLVVSLLKKTEGKTVWHDKKIWAWFFFAAAAFGSILMSLSRSNWLGVLLSGLSIPFVFALSRRDALKQAFTAWVTWGALLVFALLLVVITVLIPLPPSGGTFDASLFSERALTLTGEAAISSRWQLLPPLWKAVTEHPVLGSGFGKAVTYFSDDPRIRAINPTGEYTTMTFEWGYLDLWLKLGLIGLLVYAFFVGKILKLSYDLLRSYQEHPDSTEKRLLEAMVLGGIAILAIHFFSPYLNHPLGIGYLLLWAVVLEVLKIQPTLKQMN